MLTAVLCCVYTMAAGENYVASTDAGRYYLPSDAEITIEDESIMEVTNIQKDGEHITFNFHGLKKGSTSVDVIFPQKEGDADSPFIIENQTI